MSLPAPNLDDRKFQDIVDDVKQQIGLRCPEWTDHNVSDPGVTLIELFAYMTEMMIFRLNQVPDRNYVKFLEMIGVNLEPPAPAKTDLRFLLSRFIEDRDGEEVFEMTIPARDTVVGTVRTETQEAVEFATETDLRLVRPRLKYLLAAPAGSLPDTLATAGIATSTSTGTNGPTLQDFPEVREFQRDVRENRKAPFPIFSALPQENDAFYLGFEADISRNLIELEVEAVTSAATGLKEDYPSQKWECWDSAETRWMPLTVVRDTSMGFNRGTGDTVRTANGDLPGGGIQLEMPAGMLQREVAGLRGYWIRCVYSVDLPPRGREMVRPEKYQRSPQILDISARTIGGTVTGSQCSTILDKELGQSDGLPGQVYRMGHAPVLALSKEEKIWIGPKGTPREEQESWTAVSDFTESGPYDRHFVCDTYAGEIRFGPNIAQPDGSTRQHGAVPRKGMTITLSSYRYGGGTRGNLSADQLVVLKSSYKYIAEVTNPHRADGGREQETLDHAKMRGRAILRMRDRAVTPSDFEQLATNKEASTGVGRAHCVQPRRIHSAGEEGEHVPPGVVRVLLVPALDGSVTVPRPLQLKVPARIRQEVESYLDERRLLTTVLEVGEPEYLFVSTDITLVANPQMDPERVRNSVRERLNAYIHPLTGGPNGDGWPFLRPLRLSDIYATVQSATGVAFLLDVKMSVSRVVNPVEGLFGPETRVPEIERVGLRLRELELLCTREHRITVRPMWAAETEGAL